MPARTSSSNCGADPLTIMLGYEDYAAATGAVLTGGTWTIPLSALQDPRPGRKARSAGLAPANTLLRANLPAAVTLRMLALTHTNLTPAGLYRIRAYADAFATESFDSGWLAPPGYPQDDPDGLGASIWHLFAGAVTARYWQIEIDDQANPAGFIEAGRLVMPRSWQPQFNFDNNNNSDGLNPNTPRQNSLGGVGYFNRRMPARSLRVSWGALPAEDMAEIRRIRRICNLNRQVVVIPGPDDVANFHERNFLATLRELSPIALFGLHATTGFDLIEAVPS